MKKTTMMLIGFFVLLTAGFFAFVSNNSGYTKEKLPVLGNPGHKVGAFRFVNQEGKPITQEDVKGKTYVVEYFFTTCKGICPKMNANMKKVYDAYKDTPNFLILSHTVDPETDSVPVLKAYAERFDANPRKWLFLTGDKKQLYEVARNEYLLTANEGDGGPDDFVHTQMFALVDKEGQLRGFYDGTKEEEISKLIKDIKRLMQE